jgi:transposase InsO family protein
MAFRETCAMEERIRMLSDYDTGAFSVTELSERYGVSRETFYLWRERRLSGVAMWFQDRSHAPRNIPGRTEATMIERIVALRHRFPHFGPKKLRFRLQLDSPELDWPALSTIGDILARAGLVEKVRRQRRPIAQGAPAASVLSVNSEWCVDFKGWFRTRDGRRIDPLTVTDNASRYLLEVRILRPNHEEVRPVFERLFRDFGLPDAVRSDNGPPFGSSGAGGLSRLSIWLLKLGVEPHFGRPASPQDNGRHERMHRTLAEQTTRPPALCASEQQQRFDVFRQHFNEERPHEALEQGRRRNTFLFMGSRPRCDDPGYHAHHEGRRVHSSGEIRWRGESIFIGEALAGEVVGLAERDQGYHIVRFSHHDLGMIDPKKKFHRFAPPRTRRAAGQRKNSVNNHPGWDRQVSFHAPSTISETTATSRTKRSASTG